METKEQINFALEVLYRHLESPARPGILRNDVAEEIRDLQKQRTMFPEQGDEKKYFTQNI